MEISVVSPVYRAHTILPTLVAHITAELEPMTSSYEIILVEDGSPGEDWEVIREICAEQPRVRGVKLTRNFGQQAALLAGLTHARGDHVVVMDCDLQDNPKFIPVLLEKAREGFDVVKAAKRNRAHGPLRNLPAVAFHRLFNALSTVDSADPAIGTFSVLSRKAVDEYVKVVEANVPYNIVLGWLNLPAAQVPVDQDPRLKGESSYTMSKLTRQVIVGLAASSDRLLLASVTLGLLFVLLSFAGALTVTVQYFLFGARPGWTSLTVLINLSTGLVLLSTGVLGIYLGKLIELVRARPPFRVEETLN